MSAKLALLLALAATAAAKPQGVCHNNHVPLS